MGRFALELWVGTELLDRLRFDPPLMATGPVEKNPRHPFPRPSFDDVSTKLHLQIADDPRAAYAQVVDRATGETTRYAWPPAADGTLTAWSAPAFDDAWPPPPARSTADAGPLDASADR
jgi:hypothetical protein